MGRLYKEARSRLRFYRHHRPSELKWARVYFSQYGEDVFLLEYFRGKRDGLYVDVGGYHPFAYSNSYAFYRGGWRGIVVEPNPEKAPLFRKHRPGDVLVPLAVSDVKGVTSFAVDEGNSGIVNDGYFHNKRLDQLARITVETCPLAAVLDEHMPRLGKPIDFMSVDCEGHDEVVLRSNDWERYRPLLVLCEAFDAPGAARLREYLKAQQYKQVATCGPTLIFEDTRTRADRPESYH